MKKIFIITLFQILFSSCSTSQELNYAEKLDSCFEENEISLLNEACISFEEQLKIRYKNTEVNQAYLQYLKDLREMKVHPSFFFSDKSRSALKKIKSSTVFDKVWISLDSIVSNHMIEDEETVVIPITGKIDEKAETKKEKEIELFCINPKAEYFKCVSSKATNPELIEYYKAFGQFPDISPSLKSAALSNSLKNKDFDNDILKLSVAIEFYIEMALMFPEN